MRKYYVYNILLSFIVSSYCTEYEDPEGVLPLSYGIFHSLQSVFSTLRDVPEIFEIPDVKEIYDNQFKNITTILPRNGRKAFIVIEGIKGIGKSSTSRLFAKMINGTYLRSPVESLVEIRNNVINKQSRLIRSAFHALNNYVIAEKIKILVKTTPVIMDQYWHGLTAFALSKLAGIPHHLPQVTSNIYRFPEDLLQPDITFLITVRDERRLFRMPDTGRPAVSKVFSDTMHRAYLLMRDPKLVSVNGDRQRHEIEEDFIRITMEQCSDLL